MSDKAHGKALRMIRVMAGLTQRDIGDALGVTHAIVSRIETGSRELRVSEIEKILDLTGYTWADFQSLIGMADGVSVSERTLDISQVEEDADE